MSSRHRRAAIVFFFLLINVRKKISRVSSVVSKIHFTCFSLPTLLLLLVLLLLLTLLLPLSYNNHQTEKKNYAVLFLVFVSFSQFFVNSKIVLVVEE